MSNIILAINSMIENSEKISTIEKKGQSFFFSYKGYIWKIWQWITDFPENESGFSLAYYPKVKSVSELTEIGDSETSDKEESVVYNSSDFKGKEAYESFAELYSIIREKYYGIDKVFNDIITNK